MSDITVLVENASGTFCPLPFRTSEARWTHRDPGGPAEASFIVHAPAEHVSSFLSKDARISIYDGSSMDPVWSGKYARMPMTSGMGDDRVMVEASGIYDTLNDIALDRKYRIKDLGKFVDTRKIPRTYLLHYQHFDPQISDEAIILPLPQGDTIINNRGCSVTLDMGPDPDNWVDTAYVKFKTPVTIGTASFAVYVRAHSLPSPILPGTGGYVDLSVTANPTGETYYTVGGNTGAPSRRYLSIFWWWGGGTTTTGADHSIKIEEVWVYSDTTYADGAPGLLASTVVKDALTRGATLVSSDQSLVSTTAFQIPEFYTPAPMGSGEIIKSVNNYHDYLFALESFMVPRAIFRQRTRTPNWVVSVSDPNVSIENPTRDDSSGIGSVVHVSYTDPFGQPAIATAASPSVGAQWADVASSVTFTDLACETAAGWAGTNGSASAVGGGFSGNYVAIAADANGYVREMYKTTAGALVPGRAYRIGGKGSSSQPAYARQCQVLVTVNEATGSGRVIASKLIEDWDNTAWRDWVIEFTPRRNVAHRIMFTSMAQAAASETSVRLDAMYFQQGPMTPQAIKKTPRELVREVRSKMTNAGAEQIGRLAFQAMQFTPFKGSVTISSPWIESYLGGKRPVGDIRVGDVFLLDDDRNPDTGLYGRVAEVVEISIERGTARITLDSRADAIETLVERMNALY